MRLCKMLGRIRFSFSSFLFCIILSLLALLSIALGNENCNLRNCPCNQKYIPFCGTNGVTYFNKCFFNCAQQLCDPHLRVKFEGVCAVPYRHYGGGWRPRPASPPRPHLPPTYGEISVDGTTRRPLTLTPKPTGPKRLVLPILSPPIAESIINEVTKDKDGNGEREESWVEARPKYNIDWR